MVESDHSEAEEENMGTLELSSDSVETAVNKRPRVVDSEDEKGLPAKKRRTSLNEKSQISVTNNVEVISEKNGTDEYDTREEKQTTPSESTQDLDGKSLSDSNTENEIKQEDKLIKQENESPLKDKNDSTVDEEPINAKIEKENTKSEDNPVEESVINTDIVPASEDEKIAKEDEDIKEDDETVDKKEKKKHVAKDQTTDTEVVDGLELSVECASDKEGSSSENEDEKDAKPRPKTIIVKAEPNESELECSSSEGEKSDSQEASDIVQTKPEKKRGKKRGSRTSFSKMKASGSEDSQNNNSDEDYSPRTKKKMKKSPPTRRSAKRSMESRRGRGGGARRNSHKKSTDLSDDENADATSTDRNNKSMKVKDEAEEELSDKESVASKSISISNSEEEEKSTKGRRGRRSNTGPDNNKHIQRLKKYLNVAGVKVRFQDIWADCKSNAAKIKRLKELLEKNGISGRPTLEKCKRARKKNEKMRELSELDTSNIISEGRVTRARRNMDSSKKTTISDASPRHREARNTFKRIQTVVDSDSE